MMHSYAKLESTPDVVHNNLGISAEEFDRQFLRGWKRKQESR